MAHTKYARPPRRCPRPQRRRGAISSQHQATARARQRYDRRIDLPRILPLWPHELDDESPQGRRHIVSKLRRALRAERRRGIGGHWTYDLARHVELLRVYRHELAATGLPDLTRP